MNIKMNVKLIKIDVSTAWAVRFLEQTGTLNIQNGTFIFEAAENWIFLRGNIVNKSFTNSTVRIETETNAFTFEIL